MAAERIVRFIIEPAPIDRFAMRRSAVGTGVSTATLRRRSRRLPPPGYQMNSGAVSRLSLPNRMWKTRMRLSDAGESWPMGR